MLRPSPWRQDSLSGLGNFLAFVEQLSRYTIHPLDHTLTLLHFELVQFDSLNARLGRATGEQVLRWLALALQDEVAPDHCYRLHEDEFVAILEGETPHTAHEVVTRVEQRLVRRIGTQPRLQMEGSPFYVGVLHVAAGQTLTVGDAIVAMEAMRQRVRQRKESFAAAQYPYHGQADLAATVHALLDRLLELGGMLDVALAQAETDALTGLPNSRAMDRLLGDTIRAAEAQTSRFGVLMVDGDNLRTFNKISYAAGDRLIQQLARLLSRELRGEDRLGRWRLGDEFLILLADAGPQEALRVAERLVESVRHMPSERPVTISVGVAIYPDHGTTAEVLTRHVERALLAAKAQGKDRALLFHESLP